MAMERRTLVLAPWMEPFRVIPWQQAMCMVVLNKVEVIAVYDEVARSPSVAIPIPSIVRINGSMPHRKRVIRFSRLNVLLRDGFACAYCGAKFHGRMLNIDHVVPKSRGGTTRWENVVASCYPCNTRKGNKTPAEAGMTLRVLPCRPTALPLCVLKFEDTWPEEWAAYR